jgi:hypothetical protein
MKCLLPLFFILTNAVSLLCGITPGAPAESDEPCAILISPEHPQVGNEFRVLVAANTDNKNLEISAMGPSGQLTSARTNRGGGPPFWQSAAFQAGRAGDYTVRLMQGHKTLQTLQVVIAAEKSAKAGSKIWECHREWNRDTELFYSAWIDALFHTSVEGASWTALHEVMRDSAGNILYNHLGLGEDKPSSRLKMEPDCADNPFYLRAYFSWKLGLAFGFHETGRGTLRNPPHTDRWFTNCDASSNADPVKRVNSFLRTVMNTIHSGTARTRLEDDHSDYYPLALTREALRPGVVFADPYGHTFVLVRWIEQAGDSPGVLLAVDAQPDGTVAIKRFWKGNFLFNTEGVIGEPGFKAFRPMVLEAGKPRLLTNKEIAIRSGYGTVSLEQKKMASETFYDKMERLINPQPLDPEVALTDLFKALHEQLLIRVESVGNGEKYMQAHPGTVINMPTTAAGLFQAGGLWEDYSTPNRDLRLLIAIDALLDFPDRIVHTPSHFKISRWTSPEKVKKQLEEQSREKAETMTFNYTRSNGAAHSLTIAEVLKRRAAFEMGYNPNDGVEIRWGAPAGSEEIKSCRRRSPASQVEKMQQLRTWFQKRLHPPT